MHLRLVQLNPLLVSCALLQCCAGVSYSNITDLNNTLASQSEGPSSVHILSTHASAALSTNEASLGSSTNATGFAAANACWSQWIAWSTASSRCQKTTVPGQLDTQNFTWASILYETYKLCDGIPRAVVTGGERTSTTVLPGITQILTLPPSGIPTSTIFTGYTTTFRILSTECITSMPTPTCTIDSNNCKSLFSEWTAGNFTKPKPECTIVVPTGDPCDHCILYIPSVKLLYFPVTMTGDFCGNDYSTASARPTLNASTPVTVETLGTTFTSGFVYLSYAAISAQAFGTNCGTSKSGGFISLRSSDIFSYRGHAQAMPEAHGKQWPFNFGDLAPNHVPWDPWISQETCFQHQMYATCQTITEAAYRPWLVYPRTFWSMEPQWSKCGSDAFGIMDPPTALIVANQIASPTTPTAAAVTTSPVAPGMDPANSFPKATTSPQDPKTTKPNAIEPSQAAGPGAEIPNPPIFTIHGRPGLLTDSSEQSRSPDPSLPELPNQTPDVSESILQTAVVPVSAIDQSKTIIGGVPIAGAAEPNAISIGATIMSVGQTTHIGSMLVSLGTSSLVVGAETAPNTPTLNAISVLQSAERSGLGHTDGRMHNTHPSGLSGSAGAVMTLPPDSVIDGHGRTMFHGSGPGLHTITSGSRGAEIQITYGKGAVHVVVHGYLDSKGRTIMEVGSTSFTFSGQNMDYDGTTFSVVLPSIYRSFGPGNTSAKSDHSSSASRTMANSYPPSAKAPSTAAATGIRSGTGSTLKTSSLVAMSFEIILMLLHQLLS